MSGALNEKWMKAAADLDPERQRMLAELKQDYEVASAIHVPKYKGGPNPGILAELIRRGWCKQD